MRRGQATAEFALGLLVFITVLLFGIHFAEIGFLSAKVHEAQASAMWDSTAYRSYRFGGWSNSGRVSAPAAQRQGLERYADWDGRSSVTGSAPTLALTRATPMSVQCSRDPVMAHPLADRAPGFGEAGGVRCRSEADVTAFRIPAAFAEGADGFFQAAHDSRATNPLHVCGSGRPLGNSCSGAVALLLGDYALTDFNESRECPLATSSPSSCTNGAFYATTLGTFNKSMRLGAGWAEGWSGKPERWARNIVDGVPSGRITGFYLSFRGEESRFLEPVEARLGGGSWQTSPMDAWMPRTPYRTAYTQRRDCRDANGYCFLGRYPCN